VSHGDGKGKDRPSWLDISWIEGRTEARMCVSYASRRTLGDIINRLWDDPWRRTAGGV